MINPSREFIRTVTLMLFGVLVVLAIFVVSELLGPHPHFRAEKAIFLATMGAWVTVFSIILIRQKRASRRAAERVDVSPQEKKRAVGTLLLVNALFPNVTLLHSLRDDAHIYWLPPIAMSVCILIALVVLIRKEVKEKAQQRAAETMELPLSGD